MSYQRAPQPAPHITIRRNDVDIPQSSRPRDGWERGALTIQLIALLGLALTLWVGCEEEGGEVNSAGDAEEIAGEATGERGEGEGGEGAGEEGGEGAGGETREAGEGAAGETAEELTTSVSCAYLNRFSSQQECKVYAGAGWSVEEAERDCLAQPESRFTVGEGCAEVSLGQCYLAEGEALEVIIVFSGEDPQECASTAQGCTLFAEGRFEPSETCEGVSAETGGIGSGGSVFQPFELICLDSEGDERCTWQAIGGCAPEGERYIDYASCSSVLTQRPYAPVPASGFETPADDPLRDDPDYLREVEWVRGQAESCGCVCCHSESVTPRGAAIWDTERTGIWTDSFTARGLAQGAGWLDTSTLGAFPPEENNGFNREVTVLPTTDVDRMVRFFSGELARRGYSEADFMGDDPIGGPLYSQRIFEPAECELGEGVNAEGEIYWEGGRARYVYLLEEGSENPSTPPNLDLPEGTLWRLDVDYRRVGVKPGISYGAIQREMTQGFPVEGAPTSLEMGRRYYLYVLQDIAIPITRCLFTYGEVETGVGDSRWDSECRSDEDCEAPSGFCAMSPGSETGYCTAHCSGLADCDQYGLPDDWSCNALDCEQEMFTWCGPRAEIAESNGFLKECL